jgi:hypothetical protein
MVFSACSNSNVSVSPMYTQTPKTVSLIETTTAPSPIPTIQKTPTQPISKEVMPTVTATLVSTGTIKSVAISPSRSLDDELSYETNVITSTEKYTLKYVKNRRFISLEIPRYEWEKLINNEYYGQMSPYNFSGIIIGTTWTRLIYEYVNDDVDFLVYVFNTPDKPQQLIMNGYYQHVKNDVVGIGTPYFGEPFYDFTNMYSEHANRLQGIIYLTHNDVIFEGPFLHEIMHRWANYILNSDTSSGHWGNTNIYGRLGGYKEIVYTEEIETSLIAENRRFWDGPYAPFELYLMGLTSKEEVPDIEQIVDTELEVIEVSEWTRTSGEDILVRGQVTTTTYTIDDIINGKASNENQKQNCGERVPSYLDSPKNYNLLFVVIDYDEITSKEIDDISIQIDQLAYQGEKEDGVFNFWEATGGLGRIASLSYSEVKKR